MVSVPLKMFRLWAFMGMAAQVLAALGWAEMATGDTGRGLGWGLEPLWVGFDVSTTRFDSMVGFGIPTVALGASAVGFARLYVWVWCLRDSL